MVIKDPCCITSRLLPGVRVGDTEISIEYADRAGLEGRTRYRYYIDVYGGVCVENDDIQSGCGGGNLQDGLESLLCLLSAFGEAVTYEKLGRQSENGDLFPASLREWAEANQDEFSILEIELQDHPGVINE
jgi:hypothetical protein